MQVNQNNMTICVHKHNQKMTRNFDSFHTPHRALLFTVVFLRRLVILEDINNVYARGDLGDHSPHQPDQPDAAKTESQPRKHKILRAGCENKKQQLWRLFGP